MKKQEPQKSEKEQTMDLKSYKQRKKRRKHKIKVRILVTLIVLAGIGISGKVILDYHTYSGYKVISSLEKTDAANTQYVEYGEDIFRYSTNGASLVKVDDTVLWDTTYEIANPQMDICSDILAVYAEKGNQIYIFDRTGSIGNVTTEMPILKARVSQQGMVGAILEDGDTTWINFYDKNGNEIATCKTRIDSPGYPVDFAVSADGKLIMVSYLVVNNETITSYVAFYNLGEEGQGEIDNIVSGYQYDNVMIPQVAYLKDSRALAFVENGVLAYTGNSIPQEEYKISEDNQIISTFYDNNYIGLVTRSDNAEKQYMLTVYKTNGKRVMQKEFNVSYNTIKMTNNEIVMYNDTQICVISLDGSEKYNGNFDEGNINNVFHVGYWDYLVVSESGFTTIRLKW